MNQLFIIRNQGNFYLTRQEEWHNGNEPAALFKTPHYDIALNTLIEMNTKHFALRAEVMAVEANARGVPIVEVLAQAQMELAEPDEDQRTAEESEVEDSL